MVLDLPGDPFRVQCRLRADDDREAAVADADLALRLQLAGRALPNIQPDVQSMFFGQRACQRFDTDGVVMVVAEEDVELPHGLLFRRFPGQERLIESPLIKVRQEPVLQ